MKTLLLSTLVLFTALSLCAQTEYRHVDSVAQSFQTPYTDATDLALKLTQPYSTWREKARAIFTWIAHNIRYDYQKYQNPSPSPRFGGRTPADVVQQREAWLENEIRNTLRKKRGVCADYSYLFQKMATAAGLESVVVTGTARKPRGRGGSHAWNAVKLEGEWRLLDVTWGAGYVDDEDEHFIRRFAPGFFDTPPALFIQNHLPDDERWQLLGQPLSKREFNRQLMVNYGSADLALTAIDPPDGQLRKVNGVVKLRLKLGVRPPVFVVAVSKTREIPAQVRTTDDGWTVLTFSPGSASEVTVFAGKSRRKMPWLGRFSIL